MVQFRRTRSSRWSRETSRSKCGVLPSDLQCRDTGPLVLFRVHPLNPVEEPVPATEVGSGFKRGGLKAELKEGSLRLRLEGWSRVRDQRPSWIRCTRDWDWVLFGPGHRGCEGRGDPCRSGERGTEVPRPGLLSTARGPTRRCRECPPETVPTVGPYFSVCTESLPLLPERGHDSRVPRRGRASPTSYPSYPPDYCSHSRRLPGSSVETPPRSPTLVLSTSSPLDYIWSVTVLSGLEGLLIVRLSRTGRPPVFTHKCPRTPSPKPQTSPETFTVPE